MGEITIGTRYKVHSFIHSFMQLFIEHLLCALHCFWCCVVGKKQNGFKSQSLYEPTFWQRTQVKCMIYMVASIEEGRGRGREHVAARVGC